MLLIVTLLLSGLCAIGYSSAVAQVAGHHSLQTPSTSNSRLKPSDIVIVYTTTLDRLPLVHATRPARRGIRTFIVLQDASAADDLNARFGGPKSKYNETYLSWLSPSSSITPSITGGLYGRLPLEPTHPLHQIGPTWAMAPLLAHAAVLSSSSTPTLSTQASSSSSSSSSASATTVQQPFPYRWMLVARDDTLWRPSQAVKLLSMYDSGVAAAISDHLMDFNGHTVLAPSGAAAVCLPCGFNLTELLGRRHPPGVPQPACPVCRPAGGCEFRFDLCGGLAGGPYCGTKRFLGSGDRCSHSWAAGGAGVALSSTLLSYIDQAEWASCVRAQRPSTGERSLGRCLWRKGFSFTHPATGLAELLTKDVFSTNHMLFGNPVLREDVFGTKANELLKAGYNAEEAGVAAARIADSKAAVPPTPAKYSGATETLPAVVSVPASTRLRPAGAPECDSSCRRWLSRKGVSVHLDVPYADGVNVKAAAAVLGVAAEAVAKAVA